MSLKTRWIAAAVAALGLLAATLPAAAGQGWWLKIQGEDKGEAKFVEIRLDESHIRAGETTPEQEIILDESAITVLNHNEQTFMTLTYVQIESMLQGMMSMMEGMADAQKEAMREAMKDVPDDQRAEVEAALGVTEEKEDEQAEVSLKKTSETESIAGLKATKHIVLEDGEPMGELWLTNDIPMTLFESLAQRFGKFLSQLPGEHDDDKKYLEAMSKLDGFPVKMVDLSDEERKQVMQITEARRQTFKDADFTGPDGYEQTQMDLGGFGGNR